MKRSDHKPSLVERRKIAAKIVELSGQVLSTAECKHHIALKIGTGAYSNAVWVYDSGSVKFFIQSTDLLNRAKEEGFAPSRVESIGTRGGLGYKFAGLGLSDIQEHEELLKTVIQESVSEATARIGQAKKR